MEDQSMEVGKSCGENITNNKNRYLENTVDHMTSPNFELVKQSNTNIFVYEGAKYLSKRVVFCLNCKMHFTHLEFPEHLCTTKRLCPIHQILQIEILWQLHMKTYNNEKNLHHCSRCGNQFFREEHVRNHPCLQILKRMRSCSVHVTDCKEIINMGSQEYCSEYKAKECTSNSITVKEEDFLNPVNINETSSEKSSFTESDTDCDEPKLTTIRTVWKCEKCSIIISSFKKYERHVFHYKHCRCKNSITELRNLIFNEISDVRHKYGGYVFRVIASFSRNIHWLENANCKECKSLFKNNMEFLEHLRNHIQCKRKLDSAALKRHSTSKHQCEVHTCQSKTSKLLKSDKDICEQICTENLILHDKKVDNEEPINSQKTKILNSDEPESCLESSQEEKELKGNSNVSIDVQCANSADLTLSLAYEFPSQEQTKHASAHIPEVENDHTATDDQESKEHRQNNIAMVNPVDVIEILFDEEDDETHNEMERQIASNSPNNMDVQNAERGEICSELLEIDSDTEEMVVVFEELKRTSKRLELKNEIKKQKVI